jgi:hypothetical protein
MTRFTFLAALTLAAVPPLPAQSIGVSLVRLDTDHSLVHDLTGVELRVGSPNVATRLGIRFGFGRLTGDQERVGSTCSGLVEPGMCPPEPLHDETRFTRGRGELSVALLRHGRSSLDLVAGLDVGHIRTDTYGRTSGARIAADKTIWGPDIGGEARWIPSSTLPVGLEASFAVGGYHAAGNTVILDGYTPFERSFSVKRVRVGAVFELR